MTSSAECCLRDVPRGLAVVTIAIGAPICLRLSLVMCVEYIVLALLPGFWHCSRGHTRVGDSKLWAMPLTQLVMFNVCVSAVRANA
jgi:hypothetical protein